MVPESYEAWRKCITEDCKINLTKEFAEKRLKVYLDQENHETKKFLSLYGSNHLKNIINWYQTI